MSASLEPEKLGLDSGLPQDTHVTAVPVRRERNHSMAGLVRNSSPKLRHSKYHCESTAADAAELPSCLITPGHAEL
jgi:hypothetical protein